MILRTLLAATILASSVSSAYAACSNPMRRDSMMFPGMKHTPSPEAMPDIAFIREDGTTGNFDELRGNPTIVSFWRTICHGCQLELPSVNAMLGEYKNRSDINFLSLTVQDTKESARAYLDRKGHNNVDVNLDPGAAIFSDLCLAATPTHVILDENAQMVGVFVGPREWTDEDTTAFLDDLIIKGTL